MIYNMTLPFLFARWSHMALFVPVSVPFPCKKKGVLLKVQPPSLFCFVSVSLCLSVSVSISSLSLSLSLSLSVSLFLFFVHSLSTHRFMYAHIYSRSLFCLNLTHSMTSKFCTFLLVSFFFFFWGGGGKGRMKKKKDTST